MSLLGLRLSIFVSNQAIPRAHPGTGLLERKTIDLTIVISIRKKAVHLRERHRDVEAAVLQKLRRDVGPDDLLRCWTLRVAIEKYGFNRGRQQKETIHVD